MKRISAAMPRISAFTSRSRTNLGQKRGDLSRLPDFMSRKFTVPWRISEFA
jgi:hypothetical protein